jgi:hypothetical protein
MWLLGDSEVHECFQVIESQFLGVTMTNSLILLDDEVLIHAH